MRTSAFWTRVLPLAVVMAATMSAGIAVPTAASCPEIPLPDPTDRRAVVFIGTVVNVDGERTRVEVEAWYLGDEPTDSAVVLGGRMYPSGEYETSADWERRLGERYAVVAQRSPSSTLTTEVCHQEMVTERTLSRLSEIYGDPSIPPFVPGPTAQPSTSIHPTEAPVETETPLDTEAPAETATPSPPSALPPADLIDSQAAGPEEGEPRGVGLGAALVLAAAAAVSIMVMARRRSRRPS